MAAPGDEFFPITSLAPELLVRVSASLAPTDAWKLSIACRALKEIFDSSARADAFILRYGTEEAAHRLFHLTSDALRGESSWLHDTGNLEMARRVFQRNEIRDVLSHNELLDVAIAGTKADFRRASTRELTHLWLELANRAIPRGVDVISTNHLLFLFRTGGTDLYHRAMASKASGATLGLAALRNKVAVVRVFEQEEEDDAVLEPNLRDILALVAPSSILCFDLANVGGREAEVLCDHYKSELGRSAKTKWKAYLALKNTEFDVSSWNPWLRYKQSYCDDWVLKLFDRSTTQTFASIMWSQIRDAGKLGLRRLIPERMDRAIKDGMHPMVVQSLAEMLLERDGNKPGFAEGIIGLARSFQDLIDYRQTFVDDTQPIHPLQRLNWCRYFALWELNNVLFHVIGRGSTEPGRPWRGRRYQPW
ncbi:hypothetical protein DFJ74DRAFT_660975 [Hyaloraphidium curvatum]|nr:hypothetical protein DFJ74DRAFT_660975 [Hyaloraphidium curvatum]